MSNIVLFIFLIFNTVNCIRPEKDCKFCQEYHPHFSNLNGRDFDDSGPGGNTWDEHYRTGHRHQDAHDSSTYNSDSDGPSNDNDSSQSSDHEELIRIVNFARSITPIFQI